MHESRNCEIESRYRSGETLASIGSDKNLSRERVRQILERRGVSASSGGQAVRQQKKRFKIEMIRKARRLAKVPAIYGCSIDFYNKIVSENPNAARAYKIHQGNARYRNVPFYLTFDQWWGIWEDSGKWNKRGRGRGQFCMCRKGDTGAYSVGNVFIGLASENVQEGNYRRHRGVDIDRKIF